MRTFKFYKENNKWYVDLPEWNGDKSDLEMVVGADDFLDILSEHKEEVNITVSTEYFDGSRVLESLEGKEQETMDLGGGNWYEIRNYSEEQSNHVIWLCDVTKFVFGKFPSKIFFRSK